MFLVHGEDEALDTLYNLIQNDLDLKAIIPQLGEIFVIKGTGEAVPEKVVREKV